MRRAIIAAAVALVVAWGGSAGASGPAATATEAKDLYDEGVRLYNLAEYDAAIERFKAAYLLSADPELLFDIAQAYRRQGAGGCSLALEFYRTYQRVTRDKPGSRPGLGPLLAETAACANAAEPKPAGTSVADVPATTAASTAAAPPPPVEQPPPSAAHWPAPPSAGRPSVLGWSLAGLGAVTLGVGVALWIGTRVDFASLQGSHCAPSCDLGRLHDIQTREVIGYTLGAVGTAVLGLGLAFVWVRGRTQQASVWIAPSGTGALAGLSL